MDVIRDDDNSSFKFRIIRGVLAAHDGYFPLVVLDRYYFRVYPGDGVSKITGDHLQEFCLANFYPRVKQETNG